MKSSNSIPSPRPVAASRGVPHRGQLIGERYRLQEWLESGAMGSVWRAEQVRLRSPAAIKFLDPSLIEFPEMHDRFLQEARAAAAVQSAHVVQIFDYGSEAGLPYIAMEFLHGENLDARLARRGLLTPRELNKIFSEVARGLGQAHALGVIHRDVKPANIFLAREGKHDITKLIDFGIAKVQAEALRVSQITATVQGTVLGTPQYMSPEQLRGRAVDYRTDLWALGVIACECLTGRHPFFANTIGDLSVQICTEEPPAPSTLGEVPAGFDAWFSKSTRKEPLERFESVGEMSDALERILLAPGEREPATLRAKQSLKLPSREDLSRAWLATSRRVSSLGASALENVSAVYGVLADTLTGAALRATDYVRLLDTRRWWSGWWSRWWPRSGARTLAWAGLVLVACGLLLWGPQRATAQRDVEASLPSREVLAVSPAAASPAAASPAAVLPEVQPELAVRAPASVSSEALPILETEDLPPVVERTVEAPPKPPPAAPRRAKPAGVSAGSAPTPFSPMSVAMGQMGARIAQGGDPPRRASKRAPAARPARPRPAAQDR